MPSFRLVDNAGAPLTTATPTFVKYCDRLGVARTQPAISHIGGGLYNFLPTPSDISDGIGYLIDCGANSFPRRGAGFVGDEHVFFAIYDGGGSFLAGQAASITHYLASGGVALVPVPTIAGLGSGLYAFTPTASDRVAGGRFAIDCGAGSEPNRYVGGDLGDGIASPEPTGPVASFAVESTQGTVKRDLAFDAVTGTFIRRNGQLTFTTGREAIAQAVGIMLRTILGEWFLDVTDGVPYFDQVMVKNPNLSTIEAMLRQKIEAVPGIKSVKTISLTLNKNRTLTVVWLADSDLGEIAASDTIGG